MKNHRRILHVATHARTTPAEGFPGALQTDPLAWTARGILILALVLGSLGAEAVALSGHGGVGHVTAYQPAGNTRLAASPDRVSSSYFIGAAWMY